MTKLAVEMLVQKKQQLENKIELMEARESEIKRKQNTRRKILASAFILEKHEGLGTMDKLVQELDQFLHKPEDRRLFGLIPK